MKERTPRVNWAELLSVVLRLEPPQPREPGRCRAPHGKATWADVYPKGLRGLSTRLAYCSGGPVSGPPRLLCSCPLPRRHAGGVGACRPSLRSDRRSLVRTEVL